MQAMLATDYHTKGARAARGALVRGQVLQIAVCIAPDQLSQPSRNARIKALWESQEASINLLLAPGYWRVWFATG